ncbi:MAG TPA: response regulator [Polyangiaceae bacterium]|nr:response regulator [Polyangiaceae bacterium]
MQTLLLVDADPVSRCVLDVHLRKEGYNVTVAADGAEALEKVDSAAPDIVVTDTQLPRLDGFELVRRIRAMGGADPSIVFLATNMPLDDRKRALDLGVEDYLTKPVYLRELSARIQFLLAKRTRRSIEERALSTAGPGRPVGSTRDLALIDVIRSFEASHQSGVVRLRNGMHEAHVFFRDGNVVDADLGPLRAEAALQRALLWDDASFEVDFRPVANEDAVGRSTQAVVLAGMRRMDEWVRLCAQVKPLAALLDVHPPQLLERLHDLTEIPEGLRALVPPSPWSEAPSALLENGPTPKRDEGPIAARPAPAQVASALPRAEADVPPPPSPQRTPSQRPSAAPWTREVDPPSELAADTVAAGVPRAIGATTKRVAATSVAVVLVLGAVVGLRSLRARQLRDSDEARSRNFAAAAAMGPAGGAVSASPPEPAIPSPAADLAPSATASAPERSSGQPLSPASAVDPWIPRTANVGLAAVPAADPTAKGQERALDVKFESHSLSPLVRDAHRALLKGDTEGATSLAHKAISEAPTDADGWLTLAAARKASGDLAGAGDAYRGCIAQAKTAGVMNCRTLVTR